MNGLTIEGFDDLEELLLDLNITEEQSKKAISKSLSVIHEEVKKNTPEDSGRMKRNVKKVVQKDGLGVKGMVVLNDWRSGFQEWGTSSSKKHVGFFERSVEKTKDSALNILAENLFK